jgi:DNA polymerase-3 subunit epsilon
MIKEKGRNNNEYACVLVLNGIYKGFGYINKRKKIRAPHDYLELITMLKDNNDIKRILNAYLKNDPETVISLN